MPDGRSITVTVKADIRQSLARELREAADALDPQSPSETAEDLRGARAEIDRLNAIIRGDIPDPEADATVEKVARVLNVHLYVARSDPTCAWDDLDEFHGREFRVAARAVLAALAGDDNA